jgi:hypothetical protein
MKKQHVASGSVSGLFSKLKADSYQLKAAKKLLATVLAS